MGRLSGDVVLGQHVFERPIVVVSGDDKARMGARALAPFTVIFDRRRHAVRFTRVTTDPISTPALRSLGISTAPGSGGPLIDDIIPGTPAAALDIQRGDRLLTVDGQAIGKLSNAEVRRMIDERNELVLVLRRGDQLVEVRVPVIDLVP
jgi:C-terminal processing protease CtpA/Prc